MCSGWRTLTTTLPHLLELLTTWMSANRGMQHVETSISTLHSCDTMLMTLSLYFEDYVALFSLVGSTVFNGIQAVDVDQPGKQTENWKLWKFIFNFNPMYCIFIRSLLYCGVPYGAWALLRLSGVWKPSRRTAHSRKGNAEKSHHKQVKHSERLREVCESKKLLALHYIQSFIQKVRFLFLYRFKTFTKFFPSF